jgi:site-specific DNA-methyltransferase (adenine-specific)
MDKTMTHTLHLGDCRHVMATLDDNSIDAIVCDPPYELGFMGKAWDNTGIAYDVTVWQQCLRVLKPGGHLVAFGGSRTYHRLAVAIEDAGFEIRDQIQWIYGSGFPKSLDVSKAMDKQAGAVREVVGLHPHPGSTNPRQSMGDKWKSSPLITAPSTDLAKQWQGWGTALKPAHEPAVLARKPLCGTVADNVMTWGVGGLNIDGTRVGDELRVVQGMSSLGVMHDDSWKPQKVESLVSGRWPANVILDEDAATALDMQSGVLSRTGSQGTRVKAEGLLGLGGDGNKNVFYGDSGGASRFFYTAKASKAEREAGLYYEEWQPAGSLAGGNDKRNGKDLPQLNPRANHHPTVKPLSLMRYLVRLVTPKGGKVLDPFMGSGSTGCASILEGFDFVGIDITPEYVAIAEKRIAHYAVTSPLEGF